MGDKDSLTLWVMDRLFEVFRPAGQHAHAEELRLEVILVRQDIRPENKDAYLLRAASPVGVYSHHADRHAEAEALLITTRHKSSEETIV